MKMILAIVAVAIVCSGCATVPTQERVYNFPEGAKESFTLTENHTNSTGIYTVILPRGEYGRTFCAGPGVFYYAPHPVMYNGKMVSGGVVVPIHGKPAFWREAIDYWRSYDHYVTGYFVSELSKPLPSEVPAITP